MVAYSLGGLGSAACLGRYFVISREFELLAGLVFCMYGRGRVVIYEDQVNVRMDRWLFGMRCC